MSQAQEKKQTKSLNTIELLALLPHRHPMLLIDGVEEIAGDERAVGVKNVTHSEPWFGGHFPDAPVMPGVFIIEAMGQTAAALVASNNKIDPSKEIIYFMGIDKARFRHPVVPGDTLRIEVVRLQTRGAVWKFKGTARVRDVVVAEAEYMAMHYKKDQIKE